MSRAKKTKIPQLATFTCKRCLGTWTPRNPQPQQCPKCRSPYWNKERVRKANPNKA